MNLDGFLNGLEEFPINMADDPVKNLASLLTRETIKTIGMMIILSCLLPSDGA